MLRYESFCLCCSTSLFFVISKCSISLIYNYACLWQFWHIFAKDILFTMYYIEVCCWFWVCNNEKHNKSIKLVLCAITVIVEASNTSVQSTDPIYYTVNHTYTRVMEIFQYFGIKTYFQGSPCPPSYANRAARRLGHHIQWSFSNHTISIIPVHNHQTVTTNYRHNVLWAKRNHWQRWCAKYMGSDFRKGLLEFAGHVAHPYAGTSLLILIYISIFNTNINNYWE